MRDQFPPFAIEASAPQPESIVYTFCTLVSRPALYRQMLESFVAAGFTEDDCEFLYLDNTASNRGDGYRGLNQMIARARGTYVILCHQDLIAVDPRTQLDACLAELSHSAPDWGVVGNAGFDAKRHKHFRLTDRFRYDDRIGTLPGEVETLDENFLLLRRDALLGFSHDLAGFHLYGPDLVTQAAVRGRSAWVVDFHIEHIGVGTIDAGFKTALVAFEAKYRRAFTHRKLRTSVTTVGLGRRDLESLYRLYKLGLQLQGRKPFAALRPATKWLEALPCAIHEWRHGPRYKIDGTVFTIPKRSPLPSRKALLRGTYEIHKRHLMTNWLSRNLPVVEIGGSYGIVSHAIRKHLDADQNLIIVEANPDILATCRANVALAEGPTTVLGAALSYNGEETVRIVVTDTLHNSHLAGDGETAGTVEVNVITLASILDEHRITAGYSLVCDIEGGEFDLLLNDAAALAQCQCIVMEIHPTPFMDRGQSVSAFLAMLTVAGFTVVDHAGTVIVAMPIRTA